MKSVVVIIILNLVLMLAFAGSEDTSSAAGRHTASQETDSFTISFK